ncbi:MAG: P-type conjugative transfer protein TrbJ [Sedimenticola sp.]
MSTKTKTALLLLLIATNPTSAWCGAMAGGSSEITQIANNIELFAIFGSEQAQLAQKARQIANEVQMINNQLTMYRNMLDNTAGLNSMQWGSVFNQLRSLATATQQGTAIAYSSSNMDAMYQQRYQGYQNYLNNNYDNNNFRSDYRTWYNSQRDGIHGALRSANLQHRQFRDEESTLEELQEMSQSAGGRMQALQVGHQISMQQARQTQKLRELVMAQTQMQGNYLASEAAKEAANQARSERFFTTPSGTVLGNEQQYDPSTISGTNY